MAQDNPSQPTPALMLVQRLAADGLRIFSTEQARRMAPEVGLSDGYVRQAMHHLARSGWLVRLRKGLYALSSSVPGISPAHEFEVAMSLVRPAAISHFSAMHYHELTDQIPQGVLVLTTTGHWVPRTHKARNGTSGYRVGGTVYHFVQVKPERFFGTKEVWIGEARVTVTDMERTLVDGLLMPQYCGGFAEVVHAIRVARDRVDLKRLMEYALRLDAATAKRLGWVLDRAGTPRKRLIPLQQVEVTGYNRLDPTGPRQGPTIARCYRRLSESGDTMQIINGHMSNQRFSLDFRGRPGLPGLTSVPTRRTTFATNPSDPKTRPVRS